MEIEYSHVVYLFPSILFFTFVFVLIIVLWVVLYILFFVFVYTLLSCLDLDIPLVRFMQLHAPCIRLRGIHLDAVCNDYPVSGRLLVRVKWMVPGCLDDSTGIVILIALKQKNMNHTVPR